MDLKNNVSSCAALVEAHLVHPRGDLRCAFGTLYNTLQSTALQQFYSLQPLQRTPQRRMQQLSPLEVSATPAPDLKVMHYLDRDRNL